LGVVTYDRHALWRYLQILLTEIPEVAKREPGQAHGPPAEKSPRNIGEI
jgi:hypothetical protein